MTFPDKHKKIVKSFQSSGYKMATKPAPKPAVKLGTISQKVNFDTAVSILDKVAYWQEKDPSQVVNILKTLENYPEVSAIVETIKNARENPAATKQLVSDYRSARKRTPKQQTDDDVFNMMLANSVFARENVMHLSSEVTSAMETETSHFKGFGEGDFGGSGSSGKWDPSSESHHTQQQTHHQQQDYHTNSHDYTTQHHETVVQHDYSSNTSSDSTYTCD